MPFGRNKAARGNNALALDAADGVIDGRYFGAPIAGARQYGAPVVAAPAYGLGGYGAPLMGGYAAPVMGGYAAPVYGGYAAPVVGGTRVVSVTRSTVPLVGATTYAGALPYAGYAAPMATSVAYGGYAAPVASSALALDAADGVIDGRFYGAPIASPALATTYAGGFPYAGAYAAPMATSIATPFPATYGAYGAPLVGGYGATYGAFGAPAVTTRVASITRTTVATPGFAYGAAPVASGALALDAADGVIDGRFYGAPIVNRTY